ncbi:hypothetical protein L798_02043, partial [Zootermopsis nevadensis]
EEEVEGFHLVYHRGAEIGYYKGVIDILLIISKKRKHVIPDKVVSALQKVSDVRNHFPSNVEDVDIIAAHDNVGARFKKACALLKIDGTFPEVSKFSF